MSNTTNALDELLLVEVVVYNPNKNATETRRYSTGKGHTTGPAETPADTFYDPRIKQALDIQRTMFAARTTKGRSTVGYGAIVLYNGDGALDDYASVPLSVDKRVITIRRGPVGGAYPADFPADFVGTMANVEVTQDEVRLLLRDRQAELNVPLQTTKYTGAGLGTLEGVAGDIKGKPKPVCYGAVSNVPAVNVESAKLIYQVADAAVQTFNAIYDRGVSLTIGGTYANTTDLLDNALAPSAGQAKTYSGAEGSYFRLGSQPDGQVTADITQGANAAARYVGQVFTNLLTRAGFSSGDWNATDITDIDAAAPYVLGFWQGAEEAVVADVLDRVVESVGASWFADLTGDFRIKQLVSPTGTAVETFTDSDILREKKLTRITPNDQGQGIPTYRCKVRYAKNYTVQDTDLAAAVTQARREVVNKEWREAIATDATVQTAHPLAIESVEDSLLTVEADAQAEATRRQALRGVVRNFFELTVPYNDDTAAIELNDVIELAHSRYGLGIIGGDTGALVSVLGLASDAENRELTLTVWGPTNGVRNRVTQDATITYRTTSTGAFRTTQAA